MSTNKPRFALFRCARGVRYGWMHPQIHLAIARKRATRSSVAGCVLNKLAMPPPDNGFMILLSERLIATITGKKKSVTN